MLETMPEIRIHDLEYEAFKANDGSYNLPGIHPTDDPMATKATRNTEKVADFMSTILDRKGDHIGTIKCVGPTRGTSLEWKNACWFPPCKQAVYGQQLLDPDRRPDQYISLAENLGIVAHEMFHGVTCETAKLHYRGESGSLHESYSDIFAIIILNDRNKNIGKWNWELGRPFGQDGDPMRNFADPTLHEQPDHWEKYREVEGLHYNCGIHNKAAYNLINATYEYAPNKYLFDTATLSNLFYRTLCSLSREATFRESGLKLMSTAATIFRKNGSLQRRAETAINKAFADVGITL